MDIIKCVLQITLFPNSLDYFTYYLSRLRFFTITDSCLHFSTCLKSKLVPNFNKRLPFTFKGATGLTGLLEGGHKAKQLVEHDWKHFRANIVFIKLESKYNVLQVKVLNRLSKLFTAAANRIPLWIRRQIQSTFLRCFFIKLNR
uniref:5-hydroxytryptamine receptor 3A-like n=1 Tax=Phallusia mammillata TaxID=59560 RepID=A0A6F9DFI6_9ASCI|nr:5-hydroxytryptamine receptor 3A-like [Phallusia mammillata]